MVKIALIGSGSMANRHSECYAALENVEIVAVSDVRKECADELAKKFGCPAYYSGMDLIENVEADAVDICLPTFLHTEHAIKAMEKGMNVFIEKPVCMTKEEGNALLEAEKRTGAKVMVGHAIRFWDEYAWLKNVVDSGKYGKILSAVFKRVSPWPTWGWDNWFLDPKRSGGAALDLHIHDTDFMRFLMGEPESFNSSATYDKDTGACVQIFSTFKYADGAVALVEGGWDYPVTFPFSMEYRIKMEKATITFEDKDGCVKIYPVDGEVETPTIEKVIDFEGANLGNLSSISAYYTELKYFADCIESGAKIEKATLSDSVKSAFMVLDEMEKSGGFMK